MAGVMRKRLVFMPTKITELTEGLTPKAEAEIVHLHSRIKKIYACVNMDVRLLLIILVFGHFNVYLLSTNQVPV